MEVYINETNFRLKQLVLLSMDNYVDHINRQNAYQEIENFKNSSSPEIIMHVGFKIFEEENLLCKHFGLQLVEYCIKLHWNNLNIDSKSFIKDGGMKLIKQINSEMMFIKDVLSRILVEIIKREWPQQWPSMMEELNAVVALGPEQTEMVLLILLRLVEDVIVFKTTPAGRRKQIIQAFNLSIPDLFNFLIRSNEEHLPLSLDSSLSLRLITTALELFECLIESCNIVQLIADDFQLLKLMCRILEYKKLRIKASVCLHEIATKKGSINDRKLILNFFFLDDVLELLNKYAILSSKDAVNEDNYTFLKRLCQLFVGIGLQLCSIGGELNATSIPSNLARYLEIIYSFTIHPSQVIVECSISFWLSLLKCEKLNKENNVTIYIIQLLHYTEKLFLKVGSPSQNNSLSCSYSLLDFETETEFLIFFNQYRNYVSSMIKLIAVLIPELSCRYYLNRALQMMTNQFSADKQFCLEFESLALCLENIFMKVCICDINDVEDLQLANILCEQLLSCSILNTAIQSSILQIISSLFPLIEKFPNLLNKILEKAFSLVIFQKEGDKCQFRSKSVLILRRQACSFIVKICDTYPRLLLPSFGVLVGHVKSLAEKPDELTMLEKSSLFEALILINNEKNNYSEECAFIEDILQPVNNFLFSQQFLIANGSANNFMQFIGLIQSSCSSEQQSFTANRAQILYSIYLILAILKRSKYPENTQIALSGGFINQYNTNLFLNPSQIVVNKYMPTILTLLSVWYQMYIPENMAKKHPDYINAFQIPEIDKKNYLGMIQPSENNNTITKNTAERMQTFLYILPELISNLIGTCIRNLASEFFNHPNLALSLNETLLTNYHYIPDVKLHYVFNYILKYLVVCCPQEHWESTLKPCIVHITSHTYQMLTERWKNYIEKYKHCIKEEEENRELEVLFEEYLLRLITRDYVDFIDSILRDNDKKKDVITVPTPLVTENEDEEMMEQMEEHEPLILRQPREEFLGKLGLFLIKSNDLLNCILSSIFHPLIWEDVNSCMRSIIWAHPILKLLTQNNSMSEDYAQHIFKLFVQSLQIHGQHDTLLYIILQQMLRSYEILMPLFTNIRNIMLEISSCTEETLKSFETKWLNGNNNLKNFEKRKRDAFRALVEGAIGVNIGQLYKNDIHIKNLMPFHIKRKKPILEESGLCSLFAPDI